LNLVETRNVRPKKSVRRAIEAAERPPRVIHPRHHSRLARERVLRRWVLAGAVVIILIAVGIPAFGYYREVLRVGDTAAVLVDGQTFSLEQFARYAGTRGDLVKRQIALVQPIALPTAVAPNATPGPPQLAAQQTLQQLQSEQANLTSSGLSDLVEAKLVDDEGQKRGITATRAEMDDALRWMVSPPLPGQVSGQGLPAAPAGTYTGTVTIADAQASLATIVGTGKLLTADQVDELILKPAVIKTKLVAALAGNVATTAEQIHARHILVATLDQAVAAKKEIDAGADFATVAAKYSTDTGTKDKGGDLGWFGKGVMILEFETAAFALNPGQISDPVKTSFGYHIIQVLEKDPNRPLDPGPLLQAREKGYQDWLSKAQSDTTKVTYQPNSSKTAWVQTYVDSAG
jgi:parvulin-like peptidyl-prolyl isomerase